MLDVVQSSMNFSLGVSHGILSLTFIFNGDQNIFFFFTMRPAQPAMLTFSQDRSWGADLHLQCLPLPLRHYGLSLSQKNPTGIPPSAPSRLWPSRLSSSCFPLLSITPQALSLPAFSDVNSDLLTAKSNCLFTVLL